MTTETLFLKDPYRTSATARVIGQTEEGGVILDRTIFYARGGGQPGDSGALTWDGHRLPIATAVKGPIPVEGAGGAIVLIPAEPAPLPPVGAEVEQQLDWDRRLGHMRIHTALHLLSVVIPLPVTGGAVAADKGRLDFLMPQPPEDKMILEGQLNALITRDLPVSVEWITESQLNANPNLVKTLSVQPPSGAGEIRLVRIGDEAAPVDLQPCGGTHVARTSEIGKLAITKVENKGKQNRRVTIEFAS
ncbi:alanyl-tRNA editing protein [Jannaschia sp. CCS1]|uniref:alanyl-tRNA editing protein n=1 Tax=Jannaschia sp. (strain CCS1) TaxID=290400 RepID=UPI000053B525|nr:alanyl-tRNA editing protein [Jannaschia sp. CCS1]ABD54912.1 Ala-tRNA(Pro) hydrolase [Jannaschia sp. CCS1]